MDIGRSVSAGRREAHLNRVIALAKRQSRLTLDSPLPGVTMTANNNRKSSSPCHFEALESRELFASGTLDPAFNGTGKATIDFGGGITSAMYEVAVQSDGKTVVAGQAWKGG